MVYPSCTTMFDTRTRLDAPGSDTQAVHPGQTRRLDETLRQTELPACCGGAELLRGNARATSESKPGTHIYIYFFVYLYVFIYIYICIYIYIYIYI